MSKKPDYVYSMSLTELLSLKTNFISVREWLIANAQLESREVFTNPRYEFSLGMGKEKDGTPFYGIHVAVFFYEGGKDDSK